MTAPIDIDCPRCKMTAGNHCRSPETYESGDRIVLAFHHAERVDAACRATASRRDDPRVLHEVLREALARLGRLATLPEDLSFVVTAREELGL